MLALEPAHPVAWAQRQKPELPKPEKLELEAKDGLRLEATYYGQPPESKAVPIVMLHDYKGNRNAFDALALSLQDRGHAVIVPDLRGHGGSKRRRRPGFADGQMLDAANLRKGDFLHMVQFDMEAVRRFLLKKNNDGEINLEKLCLIGAEMGATVALNWAAADWSAPPLATGKQGQDVKGLVLLSPPRSFKGIPVQEALDRLVRPDARRDLSLLILVGRDDSRSLADANRMYKSLERWYSATQDHSESEIQKLDFVSFGTSLQGTKLLDAQGQAVEEEIARFVDRCLVRQDFPWTERGSVR
jgi:pimeloyl-ACP methyl ester carboxylesterase